MPVTGVHEVDWSTRHNAYDSPTAPNEACEHLIAEHWHGTHACYVLDPCRCEDCAKANSIYEKSRISWLAGARPHPLVDADPIRAHIDRLVAAGMGRKRIAEVSGVPHGAIWKLMDGDPQRGTPPSKRVRRETADAILNCPWTVADGARVDSREAKAIVRELVARGWSKAAIGRIVHHNPDAYSLQIVKPTSRQVLAGNLRALRTLLDQEVPKRTHNATGKVYQPNPDYRPRRIAPSTPGVPPEGQEAPLPPPGAPQVVPELPRPTPTALRANGVLRCQQCDEPLAGHRIGQCRTDRPRFSL